MPSRVCGWASTANMIVSEAVAVGDFPSLRASELLRLLQKEPIRYRILLARGSHRVLVAEGRPRIIFAFHEARTVPGWMVRRVLVEQAGVAESEALRILGRR